MSFSRCVPNCSFCNVGKGIYTCPKCNRKYCSSYCYKSQQHEQCSEPFFRQWVEETLREQDANPQQKGEMIEKLKKFEEHNPFLTEEPTIDERFANIDINNANEDVIWQNLTDAEKADFEAFIRDEDRIKSLIQIKQPWWTVKTLNLVIENDDCELDTDIAIRPPYPLNLKTLSELTTVKPANCIPFNIVNIIYSYCFLCRQYNFELQDFCEESVDFLLQLSPVFCESFNYLSLDESVQDAIRKISESNLSASMVFIKSIVKDVSQVFEGPENSRSSTFLICALHDIKVLLLKFKHINKKNKKNYINLKEKLILVLRKIDYFIGWSLENEILLKDISLQLLLIMLPDFVKESKYSETDTSFKKKPDKCLIEAID